jgi:hypothetical protein
MWQGINKTVVGTDMLYLARGMEKTLTFILPLLLIISVIRTL